MWKVWFANKNYDWNIGLTKPFKINRVNQHETAQKFKTFEKRAKK